MDVPLPRARQLNRLLARLPPHVRVQQIIVPREKDVHLERGTWLIGALHCTRRATRCLGLMMLLLLLGGLIQLCSCTVPPEAAPGGSPDCKAGSHLLLRNQPAAADGQVPACAWLRARTPVLLLLARRCGATCWRLPGPPVLL